VFVIPLIAGAVGGAFAAVVAGQYLRRRKPYQAVWALALGMFAAAALLSPAIYNPEPPENSVARTAGVFGAPVYDASVWKSLN